VSAPAKAFHRYPALEVRLRLAKWYAALHGESAAGMKGGWLYDAAGRPVAQGWHAYYYARKRRIWDALEERAQAAGGAR